MPLYLLRSLPFLKPLPIALFVLLLWFWFDCSCQQNRVKLCLHFCQIVCLPSPLVWSFLPVQCVSVSVAEAMTVWRIAGWSHLRAICALLALALNSICSSLLNCICSAFLHSAQQLYLLSGRVTAGTSPIAQLSDSRRTADRGDHYRVYCQDQEIPENWPDMRQRLEKGSRLVAKKITQKEMEKNFFFERGLVFSVVSEDWDWAICKVGRFSKLSAAGARKARDNQICSDEFLPSKGGWRQGRVVFGVGWGWGGWVVWAEVNLSTWWTKI